MLGIHLYLLAFFNRIATRHCISEDRLGDHHHHHSDSDEPIERYAPALDHYFKKIFSNQLENYEKLREIFRYAYSRGGRELSAVPRRDDEWFNPRLARIGQLLISNSQSSQFDQLAAALLTTIEAQHIHTAPVTTAIQHLALANRAVLRSGIHSDSADCTTVLYVVLDEVRHLHLGERSSEEKSQILAIAKGLAEVNSYTKSHPQLLTMVNHAISQQERRCTK